VCSSHAGYTASYLQQQEKLTQEYPREVIEEVEKTTFAMREEIKEAEAAVDACYQRRARRAGLGGVAAYG
jgi:hypothetical protein